MKTRKIRFHKILVNNKTIVNNKTHLNSKTLKPKIDI